MRKLVVSNLVSLDGYYEGRGRSLPALFEHDHRDYASDTSFHLYNAERLRAADTLLLSGRTSFLAFRDDWSRVPGDPDAPAFRRELAGLMNPVPKVVVSDRLTEDDLAPWTHTRMIRRADCHREIAALKAGEGRDILVFAGRLLWNDLLARPTAWSTSST